MSVLCHLGEEVSFSSDFTSAQLLRCLEEDPYNHISACFNLLAGRLVSKRHLREKEQAMLEREESREEEEEEEEADK